MGPHKEDPCDDVLECSHAEDFKWGLIADKLHIVICKV